MARDCISKKKKAYKFICCGGGTTLREANPPGVRERNCAAGLGMKIIGPAPCGGTATFIGIPGGICNGGRTRWEPFSVIVGGSI